MGRLRALVWLAGWPVRLVLLLGIRLYRVSLGAVVGGNCRFHPSCSAYAEEAIGRLGVFRGTALSAWRLLRCSPLSRGGVDYPPGARSVYDANIREVEAVGEVPR
jgi:putative membrane protein insertion efficiency factor